MKILLIAPASGQWRQVGRRRWFNGRTFRFSMLSLLSVAAVCPPEAKVRLVDEQIEEVPWDESFDIVGITCMTALAPRAYEIAAAFRQQGIPVVLGGIHPTLLPDEALRHADAVVVGDAEGLWPQVVADLRHGRSRGIYRHACSPHLRGLPELPRFRLSRRGYATLQAVQATRGCPHGCAFCSITAAANGQHRCRPMAEVIEEIRGLPSRFFLLVDDNLMANRDYAQEFLQALRPLRKQWAGQTTLALARDPELLRLASEAGCIGVFVGLETFSETNLTDMNKTCHRASEYRAAVQAFHAHGIGVEAGVVFGFDGDRSEVFRRTLKILEELQIDAIQVSLVTPLPGTRLFENMTDRILDWNWADYDFHHVVFQPRGMSVEALQAGHDWITREFYRPWRILRRIARALAQPSRWRTLPFLLVLNLAYWGRTWRWHLRGWDPAADGTTARCGLRQLDLELRKAWRRWMPSKEQPV